MNAIEKWIDRIYAETDVGRAVATSASGIVGLTVYLFADDWVVAGFSAIIVFPVLRLLASRLHDKASRHARHQVATETADLLFDQLSDNEQSVVLSFVTSGGCVLTFSQINRLPLSTPAIESLIQRGVLRTSMTADSMMETFVLDPSLFDAGQRRRQRSVPDQRPTGDARDSK